MNLFSGLKGESLRPFKIGDIVSAYLQQKTDFGVQYVKTEGSVSWIDYNQNCLIMETPSNERFFTRFNECKKKED